MTSLQLINRETIGVTHRAHLLVYAMVDGAEMAPAKVCQEPRCREALNLLVKGESDAQRRVIGALEAVCAARRPRLLPQFPILLKHLYDGDVIEEPAILEWAEDCEIDEDDDEDDDGRSEFTEPEVTKEHVAGLLAAAQPMLTWLQEAEEED